MWMIVQVPDSEKRNRADFVIDTGVSLEETEARVVSIIQELCAAPKETDDTDKSDGKL